MKAKQLKDLVRLVSRMQGFSDVVARLEGGEAASIDGAWGSACALSAAALAQAAPSVLLIVLPRAGDVDAFAADLASFLDQQPVVFPAWESEPRHTVVDDPVLGGRLRVLRQLREGSAPVVVTTIAALLQPVPAVAEIDRHSRTLRVGDEVDVDDLCRWLAAGGFEPVPAVERPGEFRRQGGILDVFPTDALDPLRIELFGDEIASLRHFDVETQRSLDAIEHAQLTLLPAAGESPADKAVATASLLDALPRNAWLAVVDLVSVTEEGKRYLDRLDDARGLFGVEATLARCSEFALATLSALPADPAPARCRLDIESIDRFTRPRSEALDELATSLTAGEHVLIACHNQGERDRLAEMLAEWDAQTGRRDGDDGKAGPSSPEPAKLASRVTLCVGHLAEGFRLRQPPLVVLSDHELFGRRMMARLPRRRMHRAGRPIESFLELREGDLVVHVAHGIARYRGMQLLQKADGAEEHLILEFRDRVRLYVPASLIHLVQKYVGGSKSAPRLSKVGSTNWAARKRKVSEAVSDLAGEMLRLQARRASRPGIAYPPDSLWQQEFEAAFPYTETDDQLAAASAVKADMQRPRPMDRLICGDVGYGKTEVAMRAAFKAVEAGRQVAVLVPTTVLAEQHFRTFSERMAEYPVVVDVLSRFKSRREQQALLKRMEEGTVDIVIGTHRLVSPDVKFRDLGLLIIDEEQRFGVEAKETLKHLRLDVDVLTMTATPIPRTLHMALLGIRDISNLETPPQDRLAVATRIVRFDAELIRRAIIRELNRNGQVFFVHNRVQSIHAIAQRLSAIVPEATIDIAHGQMPEHELEAAMLGFVSGKTDVLVCTTIIESGLDIPNANTIFIHQADRYGLADLHQLRGRVGRYKHRAYCYLVLDESRPLTPNAARRLKAVEEYSELGAGFRIAMRDLEIRGAGNILGTQQSGHIAAVGYELYCQLLENAVRRLKNEPIREFRHVAIDLPISAYLPDHYIPPGRRKIEAYRRISHAASEEDLADIREEFRDRYGPLPVEAAHLLDLTQLRLLAQPWQIDEIRLEEGYVVFGYRNASLMRRLSEQRGIDLRIVDGRTAYWPLPDRSMNGDALCAALRDLLRGDIEPQLQSKQPVPTVTPAS